MTCAVQSDPREERGTGTRENGVGVLGVSCPGWEDEEAPGTDVVIAAQQGNGFKRH